MGEKHEGREKGGGDEAVSAGRPDEGQANAGQSERQIVVHKTHVEDVAVGEHGEGGREEPRRSRGDGVHEGEEAPKENEDAEGDGEFFGEGETEEIGEMEEEQIEEDVVPLRDDVNAGGFALVDELGEPGVVEVAAEIAGFNVAMPEAGDQEEGGGQENAEEISRMTRGWRRSCWSSGVRSGGHFGVF